MKESIIKYMKSSQSVNHKNSSHCETVAASDTHPCHHIQPLLLLGSFLCLLLLKVASSIAFLLAIGSQLSIRFCTFIFNFKSINQYNRLILTSLRFLFTMSSRLLYTICICARRGGRHRFGFIIVAFLFFSSPPFTSSANPIAYVTFSKSVLTRIYTHRHPQYKARNFHTSI